MNNFTLDGVDDAKFILKRLILINSGGHAYSEFLLDSHIALFGKNNVGKTGSLAATKILLFPKQAYVIVKRFSAFMAKVALIVPLLHTNFIFHRKLLSLL